MIHITDNVVCMGNEAPDEPVLLCSLFRILDVCTKNLSVKHTTAALSAPDRRGKRNNVGIIFHYSYKTPLVKTVLLRGHNL